MTDERLPADLNAWTRELRRRDLLLAAGGAGAAAVLAACGRATATSSRSLGTASAARLCVLTPEVTEGPYWIANNLTRRNITEGQGGIPLYLQIDVVRASSCTAIAGADVEIWHANALGAYSGYGPTRRPPPAGTPPPTTANASFAATRGPNTPAACCSAPCIRAGTRAARRTST